MEKFDAMIAAKKAASHQIEERCNRAINLLRSRGEVINFAVVAKAAKVSCAYLYKTETLREQIAAIRREQQRSGVDEVVTKSTMPNHSEKSKDVIISAQARRLSEYKSTIAEQARELAALRGNALSEMLK